LIQGYKNEKEQKNLVSVIAKGIVNHTDMRDYRMIERRALLQDVHACEKLSSDLKIMKPDLKHNELNRLVDVLLAYVDERRKALLQLVRDTEKKYNLTIRANGR